MYLLGADINNVMGKLNTGGITKRDLLMAINTVLKRSASGAGQGTIDNRIEQAMDLVKSHLMSAVRSEVEELRDKISRLEESVTVLSRENEMLRANVNPDVLANLTGGGRQTSQLQADPTSQQQQQGGGGQH